MTDINPTAAPERSRRAGLATPAPRTSRWHRWMWLPVLVVGALLFLADQQALLITANPNLIPSLLLFGALLIPTTFVVWIDGRNPAHDVPFSVLLLCALLGGAIGTVTASLLESHTAARLGSLPTVMIGLIEEGAKLLVPIGVLLTTRYRANPADGLLVGVSVGTGFAVLETLGYGFVILLATGGDLMTTEGALILRGLLSPAAHIAWTGLAAAALWHAHAQRWRPRAVVVAVGTFVLVVILHALWDAFPDWPTFVVVGGISLALLVRQARRDVLAGTPTPPVPTADSKG
jgi:RsiW-degrading membrane proteinase PrsW (M82 family)